MFLLPRAVLCTLYHTIILATRSPVQLSIQIQCHLHHLVSRSRRIQSVCDLICSSISPLKFAPPYSAAFFRHFHFAQRSSPTTAAVHDYSSSKTR